MDREGPEEQEDGLLLLPSFPPHCLLITRAKTPDYSLIHQEEMIGTVGMRMRRI
jgi:hypothetical protein